MSSEPRKRGGRVQVKPIDSLSPDHHLEGPFLPQTPLYSGLSTPVRTESPALQHMHPIRKYLTQSFTKPISSLKILLLPILLYLNWELVSLLVNLGSTNPFGRFFMVSGYIENSKPGDSRYQKSWWDLLFLTYYVLFFAFVRRSILLYVARPLAKYFGLRRAAKVDRFGEQTYALFYFAVFGAWGVRIMSSLPTQWFNTAEFWKGYPHWDINAELKCYYLLQFSHWLKELLVVLLGLEKARKDFLELVVHHLVTLWLIGWSYLINMTYIGNAVYMSMDIPDAFLAFSKLLNYIQWNTAKLYAFGIFFAIWTYFRHYLNFWILWSIWFEYSSMTPESSKRWSWSDGVYLVQWMKLQIFLPMLLLQILNLFWYWLMTKILIRAMTTAEAEDDRSDDEDDDDTSKAKAD